MDNDFTLTNHGSIATLAPITEAATEWAAENLPEDAPKWGGAYAIEPRYLTSIVEGIVADGLTIA